MVLAETHADKAAICLKRGPINLIFSDWIKIPFSSFRFLTYLIIIYFCLMWKIGGLESVSWNLKKAEAM